MSIILCKQNETRVDIIIIIKIMRGLCVELDYRAAPELIWERAEIYCLFGRCCLWRRTGGSRGAISLRINLWPLRVSAERAERRIII